MLFSINYLNHSQRNLPNEEVFLQESEQFNMMNDRQQKSTIDALEHNFDDFISRVDKCLTEANSLWIMQIVTLNQEATKAARIIETISKQGSIAFQYRSRLYETLKPHTKSSEIAERINNLLSRYTIDELEIDVLSGQAKIKFAHITKRQAEPQQIELASAPVAEVIPVQQAPKKSECCILL